MSLLPVALRIAQTTVHVHTVQQYYEGSLWRHVYNPYRLMERRLPEKPGPGSHSELFCLVAIARGTSSSVRPGVALGWVALAGHHRPFPHRESFLLKAHLGRRVLFGAARRRPAIG